MLHNFLIQYRKMLRTLVVKLLIQRLNIHILPLLFLLVLRFIVRIRVFDIDRPIIILDFRFFTNRLRSLSSFLLSRFLLHRFHLPLWRIVPVVCHWRYRIDFFFIVPSFLSHWLSDWLLITSTRSEDLYLLIDYLSIVIIFPSNCFLFPLF